MIKTLRFLESLDGVRAFAPEIAEIRSELDALAKAAAQIAAGDRRLPWNTVDWDEALGKMAEVARTHPSAWGRRSVKTRHPPAPVESP